MKRWRRLLIALLVVVIVFMASEPFTHLFHRIADALIYNNYHHYLPCSSLPMLGDVEKIVTQHSDVLERIQNLDPSIIQVVTDTWTCPGKASIIVYYATHDQSTQIKEILPDKTFFGIPLSLINR